MARRLVVGVVVVVVAYGVGWMADIALNDDTSCVDVGQQTDRLDYVQRWFPPRTDCRVTSPSGASTLEKGDAEVSVTMFVLTLVLAGALLSGVALVLRAAAVLVACAAAFLVIFVV